MSAKRVLILYIKAGQGHYGISNAIVDALGTYYPGEYECLVEDVFEENDDTFQGMFQEFYSFLSNYLPPVYSFGYYFSSFPLFHDFLLWMPKWRARKRLQRLVNRFRPDLIVITHPFLQLLGRELAAHSLGRRPRLLHFVVDIEPLPWYFKFREYHLLVSTPHLKDYAVRKAGFPEERVRVSPPPLRQEFYAACDQAALKAFRRKYGFEEDRPIILIFGGGNGLPKGEKIVYHMLRHHLNADIAIVCGRNEFQKRLVHLLAAHFGIEERKVHIFGFIEDICELMAVSDIIISKAGFSAMFEILTLKKILIFSQFIWGQEKGNALYFIRNRIGFYIKRPSRLTRKVEELLVNRGLEDEITGNIERLKIRNGARETAAFIHDILADARRGER